jgi:hypothetical protein
MRSRARSAACRSPSLPGRAWSASIRRSFSTSCCSGLGLPKPAVGLGLGRRRLMGVPGGLGAGYGGNRPEPPLRCRRNRIAKPLRRPAA